MTRKGFTMIELLVVVAVLGILATLGIPRLQATRQRASAASMVSDLRSLILAQENYLISSQEYATQIAPAEVPGPGAAGRAGLLLSIGNAMVITQYPQASPSGPGWSAEITNSTVSNPQFDVCGVYVGHPSYSPNKAVTAGGVVACY
jgi:prepilin-type N-terminal cleavage/methylation domain-containing protein